MKSSSHLSHLLLSGFALMALSLLITPWACAENSAVVPAAREDAKWLGRHQAINDRIKQGRVDLLWIGDSIVQNWKYEGELVWNKYYKHRHAANLGITGDCTEQVLWRIEHGNIDGIRPKLAVVMIGQNNGGHNSAEEIAEGVEAIIKKLREKLPDAKILALGIFFRGEKPNPEQRKLASANEIISKLADGQHIFYLNINSIFLAPDGSISASLMPDFEHPSEAGFMVWAEAIEGKVAELMGDTPIKPD